MPTLFTAIIHLRSPRRLRAKVQPLLKDLPGVDDVQYQPQDSMVTVQFDGDRTGLSELVSVIENMGVNVSGIAQRQCGVALSG